MARCDFCFVSCESYQLTKSIYYESEICNQCSKDEKKLQLQPVILGNVNKRIKLSELQKEALKLLKNEEYFLVEISEIWNSWISYNSRKSIKTSTMNALIKRGLINIEYGVFKNGRAMAKISEQGRLSCVEDKE